MSVHRFRLAPVCFAALAGFAAYCVLLLAGAKLTGLIEPGRRIDAFLLGRPVHHHPLQLGAAIGSLYVASGALLGFLAARAGRAGGASSRSVVLAFGIGYAAALAATIVGHGGMARDIGHAAALLGMAALSASFFRVRPA
jgi:hypothetical protein